VRATTDVNQQDAAVCVKKRKKNNNHNNNNNNNNNNLPTAHRFKCNTNTGGNVLIRML
jgi:hypothetical protein